MSLFRRHDRRPAGSRPFPPRPMGRLIALEPRLLFDAAAAATAQDTMGAAAPAAPESTPTDSHTAALVNALSARSDAPSDAAPSDAASARTPTDSAPAPAGAAAPPADADTAAMVRALANGADDAQRPRTEVVVIDPSIPNAATLLAAVKPDAEIIVLDPSRDGVHQLAERLAGQSGLGAIHILSHGSDGRVDLGTAVLDEATLDGYRQDLATIGAALAPGGDILLYGCGVAADGAGRSFVNDVAAATGAAVGASSDITGGTGAGLNWTLEVRTAPLQAGLADVLESQALTSYQGDLGGQTPFAPTLNPVSFTTVGTYAGANADAGPGTLVFGDFDGDHQLDMAYADVGAQSNAFEIRLGHGDGTFGSASVFHLGADDTVTSLAAGDFNNDGVLDLAVSINGASANGGAVDILTGDGSGGFIESATVVVGGHPGSVTVGCLNGASDTRLDFVTTDASADTVTVVTQNPDGTFGVAQTRSVGDAPNAVAVGDLNNDGYADLVVTNGGSHTVSVLLNDGSGSGSFLSASSLTVGQHPRGVVIDDFDGDGAADIAVANGANGAAGVTVAWGMGDGTFGAPTTVTIGGRQTAIAAADVNGDGKDDLVVSDATNGTVAVLLNGGGHMFSEPAAFAAGGDAGSLAVGDLDGDGRVVIGVANHQGDSVSVLLGGGSVALDQRTTATTGDAISVATLLDSDHARYSAPNESGTEGIAITGLTTTGQDAGNVWQYSSNGDGWTDLSAATPGAALLLDQSYFLRYKSSDARGTATLDFVGWHETSAQSPHIVDASGPWDSTSAYSAVHAQVDVTIAHTLENIPVGTSVRGDDPILIAPDATVTAGAQGDFDGGSLTVVLSGVTGDGLGFSVGDGSGIATDGVPGHTVTVDGHAIGTIRSDSVSDDVVIDLHNDGAYHATAALVAKLVDAVTFTIGDSTTTNREATFTLVDGAGAGTGPARTTITLSDPDPHPSTLDLQVNTSTADIQEAPAMAMNAAGASVVVWRSGDASFDIVAQRYDAQGLPQGPEILVNATHNDDQRAPKVAIDGDGNFVVVWQSFSAGTWGVYERRFSADGSAIDGQESRVDTALPGDQTNASVAMDADGAFVVAWQSQGTDQDIYFQRYDADGVARGDETPVNTYTLGNQSSPSVAVGGDGEFVIGWQSYGQASSGDWAVYARHFDADGHALGSLDSTGADQGDSEFLVAGASGKNDVDASVAMDATGDFVVAWTGPETANAAYGDIYARRYDFEGAARGDAFTVNTGTANDHVDQTLPAAAMDANGDFAIAWRSSDTYNQRYRVYVRQYNAQGESLGLAGSDADLRVNTGSSATAGATTPAVAMDAGGGFAVAWDSRGPDIGDTYEVYAHRYDAAGVAMPSLDLDTEAPGTGHGATYLAGGADAPLVNTTFDDAWHDLAGTADTTPISGAQITITDVQPGDVLKIEGNEPSLYNLDVSYNAATGVMTLSGLDTAADYLAVLRELGFASTAGDPTVGGTRLTRSIDIALTGADGSGVTSTATATIDLGAAVIANVTGANSYVAGSGLPLSFADGATAGLYGLSIQAGDALTISLGASGQDGDVLAIDANSLISLGDCGEVFAKDHADGSRHLIGAWTGGSESDDLTITLTADATASRLSSLLRALSFTNSLADGVVDATDRVVSISMSEDDGWASAIARTTIAFSDPNPPARPVDLPVNVTTAGDQTSPAAASDPRGDTVVVWSGPDSANDGATAIFARVYGAQGEALTTETAITGSESGDPAYWPLNPSVALNAKGAYVVTWTYSDAGGYGVKAAVFASLDSSAPDSTFTVGSNMSTQPIASSVAMDGQGDFVVAWDAKPSGGATDFDIYTRRYDRWGTASSQERINTTDAGNQTDPSVAMDAAGDYVVAWNTTTASNGLDVMAQRFSADGAPLNLGIDGDPRDMVVAGQSLNQSAPSVAMDAAGDFVIAWQSDQTGADPSGTGVWARLYSAQGATRTTVLVNTITAGNQEDPSVAMDAAGDFVVAWDGPDASGTGVYARRFDATGAARDAHETPVNTVTSGAQGAPTVAINAAGDHTVAWLGVDGEDTYIDGDLNTQIRPSMGVYAHRYDAAGVAAPVLVLGADPTLGPDRTLAFIEGAGPVTLASPDLSLTLPDDTIIVNAVVTIHGFVAGDTLALDTGSRIATSDSSTGALTILVDDLPVNGDGDRYLRLTGNGFANAADFLAALGSLRFGTDSWNPTHYGDSPDRTLGVTLTTGAVDGHAITTNTATVHIGVQAINQEPTLSEGDRLLNAITENGDGGAGTTVATLLASNGGSATDPDNATIGMAITRATSVNGAFQYSINGGAWTPITEVSDASALLLGATDRVRFQPNTGYVGTADGLSFKAWDMSAQSGTAGGRGDTTLNDGLGDHNQFSETSADASAPVGGNTLTTSVTITLSSNVTTATATTTTTAESVEPATSNTTSTVASLATASTDTAALATAPTTVSSAAPDTASDLRTTITTRFTPTVSSETPTGVPSKNAPYAPTSPSPPPSPPPAAPSPSTSAPSGEGAASTATVAFQAPSVAAPVAETSGDKTVAPDAPANANANAAKAAAPGAGEAPGAGAGGQSQSAPSAQTPSGDAAKGADAGATKSAGTDAAPARPITQEAAAGSLAKLLSLETPAKAETLKADEIVSAFANSGDKNLERIGAVFGGMLSGGQARSQEQVKAMVNEMNLDRSTKVAIMFAFEKVKADANKGLFRSAIAELEKGAFEDPFQSPTTEAAVELPELTKAHIALLIGINEYQGALPSLSTPGHDVNEVGQVLERDFDYQAVVLRDPSHDQIVATLAAIGAKLGPEQSLIVYYAGHGYLLDSTGTGYWLPADARTTTAKEWVSTTDLSHYLGKVKAHQIMLVSDSCYSGSFTKEYQFSADRAAAAVPEERATGRSVVIMSSGGDEPVRDDGTEGHSVFAANLINTLKATDKPQSGFGVFANVKDRVSLVTYQEPHYGAMLSAGHEKGGDFTLRPAR